MLPRKFSSPSHAEHHESFDASDWRLTSELASDDRVATTVFLVGELLRASLNPLAMNS